MDAAEGTGFWVGADFTTTLLAGDFGGIVLTHFTIASDNDSGTSRDPDQWRILGSNDGNTFTTIFTYDNDGTSPFSEGGGSVENKVLRYDGGGVDFATPDAYKMFRFEAYSTVGGALGLSELEFFGFAAIDDSVGVSEDDSAVEFNLTAPFGSEIPLSGTVEAGGGTVAWSLNDGFRYNPLSPTSPKPATGWSSNGYHAGAAEGTDAKIRYDFSAPVTLTGANEVVIDLYGRSDCCANRDDNFDVEFLDAAGAASGIVGTVTGKSIGSSFHVRVSSSEASLPVGTTIGGFRVIGHDTADSGNFFTLMEVRAAQISAKAGQSDLGSNLSIETVNTYGTKGNVTLVDQRGTVSYDPNGQFESLAQGETAIDTFTYTASGEIQNTTGATVTGRFIKIQNNGSQNRALHIGEVEVFAPGVTPGTIGSNQAIDLAYTGSCQLGPYRI